MITTEEFAETGPMLLVHGKLCVSKQAVMTASMFQDLLKECNVRDVAKATSALVQAGCIIPIDGGAHYHVKPSQWLHDVATSAASPSDAAGASFVEPFSSVNIVQSAQEKVDLAEKAHASLLQSLDGAVLKASRWRKCIWGGAMLFSGTQLAVISRLTYVDLEWDIMEPISYFLGTGTSLVFFLYVLKYHRDHSYEDFDRTMLPARVRKYAPKEFDWNAYEKAKLNLTEARAELDYVKRWASMH